ncbi:hypothetical protein NEDG_01006 [Nematocida displodere]|uniref:Secreted protein n=1 Tax=Nematocida displodere TaxID=1805483 RepID=A0A177EAB2_9MICR|nr:hypothetical protein NEDG_01006 [Nematocida displodere]
MKVITFATIGGVLCLLAGNVLSSRRNSSVITQQDYIVGVFQDLEIIDNLHPPSTGILQALARLKPTIKNKASTSIENLRDSLAAYIEEVNRWILKCAGGSNACKSNIHVDVYQTKANCHIALELIEAVLSETSPKSHQPITLDDDPLYTKLFSLHNRIVNEALTTNRRENTPPLTQETAQVIKKLENDLSASTRELVLNKRDKEIGWLFNRLDPEKMYPNYKREWEARMLNATHPGTSNLPTEMIILLNKINQLEKILHEIDIILIQIHKKKKPSIKKVFGEVCMILNLTPQLFTQHSMEQHLKPVCNLLLLSHGKYLNPEKKNLITHYDGDCLHPWAFQGLPKTLAKIVIISKLRYFVATLVTKLLELITQDQLQPSIAHINKLRALNDAVVAFGYAEFALSTLIHKQSQVKKRATMFKTNSRYKGVLLYIARHCLSAIDISLPASDVIEQAFSCYTVTNNPKAYQTALITFICTFQIFPKAYPSQSLSKVKQNQANYQDYAVLWLLYEPCQNLLRTATGAVSCFDTFIYASMASLRNHHATKNELRGFINNQSNQNPSSRSPSRLATPRDG